MSKTVECPYKSAAELGITNAEHAGLIALIPKMLSGAIAQSEFAMNSWCKCIRYHLNVEMGSYLPSLTSRSDRLSPLFCDAPHYGRATPAQAAVALQNFLTDGEADTVQRSIAQQSTRAGTLRSPP